MSTRDSSESLITLSFVFIILFVQNYCFNNLFPEIKTVGLVEKVCKIINEMTANVDTGILGNIWSHRYCYKTAYA